MSPQPKRPRAELRAALVAAAARIVATEGPEALTLRRVADDVGTSTMAVYTHFGGMDELRRAVRGSGYGELAAALAALPRSGDPMPDLLLVCDAYYRFAVSHPDLYRAMFMERPLDEQDAAECEGIFATLIGAVAACVEEGSLAPGDPAAIATEIWVLGHGIASLELAALLTHEQGAGLARGALAHLLAGLGASPTNERPAERDVRS
jgi:AcrR family transcriptional regulator